MIPQMLYRPINLLQQPKDSGLAAPPFEIRSNLKCSDRPIAPPCHPHLVRTDDASNYALSRGFGKIWPGQYNDPAEHMLRRKTPNGTLAAGYDGTPVHWSSKPPAQKHIVLPLSGTPHQRYHSTIPITEPYRPSLQYKGWNRGQDAAQPNGFDEKSRLPSITESIRTPWYNTHTPNFAGDHPSNTGRVTSINLPSYQLSPGITVPNDVGMRCSYLPDANSVQCKLAAIQSHSINQHHGLDNIGNPSSSHAFQPLQYQLPPEQWSAPVLSQNIRDANSLHQSYTFSKNNENLQAFPNMQAHVPRLALASDEPHYLPIHFSSDKFDNSMFKEKFLSWAHRIYADLLTHLNHSKKEDKDSATTHRTTSASKCRIYPKPPRQASQNFESFKSQDSVLSEGQFRNYYDNNVSASSAISLPARDDVGHEKSLVDYSNYPEIRPPRSFNQNISHYTLTFQKPPPNSKDLLLNKAKEALKTLTSFCSQSGWDWVDGMLLGGCLAYGLADYHQAVEWYSKVISYDPRRKEAEQLWLRSVKACPSFFEPAEHLVGLLCCDNRAAEAVGIIEFVEKSLRLPKSEETIEQSSETSSNSEFDRSGSMGVSMEPILFDFDVDDDRTVRSVPRLLPEIKRRNSPGFHSSRFSIPSSENGQLMSLIHAKGTILYALGDVEGAARAFEVAVLISAGQSFVSIQDLIHKIVEVLSLEGISPLRSDYRSKPKTSTSTPLLLPPDRALQTARLVFLMNGDLPGLSDIPTGLAKKGAITTTSNSLLSLSKIYQDTMLNINSKKRLSSTPVSVGDILALYYLSLSLQPSPSTANNVGILLAGVQQTPMPRHSLFRDEGSTHPVIPGVVPGSSVALALAYYNYGLDLDPRHAHIYTNLGSLLKDIGQLTAAIAMYEKAVACDGTFDIALANLANAVKDQGHTSDAIKYYRKAVASSPDFAEAVCGLANALNSVCDWSGRGGVRLSNGDLDRWHVNEMGMITDGRISGHGSGWMKRVVEIVAKQLKDGANWGRETLQDQTFYQFLHDLEASDSAGNWSPEKRSGIRAALLAWSGGQWEGARIIRLIERAIKRAMHRWYIDKYIKNRLLPPTHYPRPQIPSTLTVPTAPTVLPFHTFTFPLSAKDVRMISQRNALRISCSTLRTPWMQGNVFPPPPPPASHLNVGYVSSDFINHPLSHLMQSIFGMHDKLRVKAFCYATTATDNSPHRQQIEREAPVFHDAHSWSIDRLVNQIIQDNIHILVNLNGYTRGARNEVFAARPAPIQMSFMGFAGTLGAEWCDYLLADETSIPPDTLRPWRRNLHLEDQILDEQSHEDEDWIYSENIIFCRDTFFCCDHAQSAPSDKFTSWDEEQSKRWKMRKEIFPGLSDDAVILGNFNQLYKIEPTTFRTWLRILDKVPKAILWLLRFPDLGESNLKKTALEWAGENVASRIWFTNVAPKHQHISRARVCDLFLDTPECNAHTTAADVLWSSTPLLTYPRYKYKMCSRIAASILKGALPKDEKGRKAVAELIAENDDQYEQFAIKLASELTYKTCASGHAEGVGRLSELRKLLYESRWTCALFDTKRWVSDLEFAYHEAWRRWVSDEGGDIYL